MKNPTCFAKRGFGCDCLEIRRCMGTNKCPFYKSHAQERADMLLVYARIRTLTKSKQESISELYYDGEKPWAKGALA